MRVAGAVGNLSGDQLLLVDALERRRAAGIGIDHLNNAVSQDKAMLRAAIVDIEPGQRSMLVDAARARPRHAEPDVDVRLIVAVLPQIPGADAGIRVDVVAGRGVLLLGDSLCDAVKRDAILLEGRDGAPFSLAQEFGADDECGIGGKPDDVAVIVEAARLRSRTGGAVVEGGVGSVERPGEAML